VTPQMRSAPSVALHRPPNREEKLEQLAQSAQFDLCGECGKANRTRGVGRWIYPAALPDGGRVRLLKTLMTNECRNNCKYCGLRCSRDVRRSSYGPAELARTFMEMNRARLVSGLFLSSSVPDEPDRTMARMVDTAVLLRRQYGFNGYIHLKVLPGASLDAIEAAARVADRVSVNLEAPDAERLRVLSPDKDWQADLRRRMDWVGDVVADPRFRARSHTTQFVVGAACESDRDLMRCVTDCYGKAGMWRAYFSAYQPPDPDALPSRDQSDLLTREHRLYQADWLIRKYGFAFDEVPFDDSGRLDMERDPKQVWADLHPEFFPVEVNSADRTSLLRVPGVGPTSVKRILKLRTESPFRRPAELKHVGVVTKRATPYLLMSGRSFAPRGTQLTIWG